MTQKKGKAEFTAKFISARGKRKALALREMDLLSELDNERILYFHDAFEKKNVVVLITELYPSSAILFSMIGNVVVFDMLLYYVSISDLLSSFDTELQSQNRVFFSS